MSDRRKEKASKCGYRKKPPLTLKEIQEAANRQPAYQMYYMQGLGPPPNVSTTTGPHFDRVGDCPTIEQLWDMVNIIRSDMEFRYARHKDLTEKVGMVMTIVQSMQNKRWWKK